MKRLLLLITACMCISCAEPMTFEKDPFCGSCIERACKDSASSSMFESHVKSLGAEDRAQMVALMEMQQGCLERHSWANAMVNEAYSTYAHAFYSLKRPMIEHVVLRALDEVLNDTPNRAAALSYLRHHVESWKNASWAAEKKKALEGLVESDDVFALLVQLADSAQLGQLAEMESTPARDDALIYRWKDLGAEAQKRALEAWVSGSFYMQTSGSAQLPQYLVLDWQKRPFPEGVPEFVAVMNVESIKIQNNEVKRKDWMAKDEFRWPPLREANAHHARVDLTPWLSSADNYRISASATLEIWSETASEICLNHEEGCEEEPALEIPVKLERTYRVFGGVETGAPQRVKSDKDNLVTTKALSIDICSGEQCLAVWRNGAKTKDRSEKLQVSQGENFYMLIKSGGADLSVASRLMARSGDGKAWREIATVYGYEPMRYDIPMRADIALGDLCGHLGACKLELQLRPSLRMARRDPRMSKYWGAQLELGTVTLDMLNQTPQQLTK